MADSHARLLKVLQDTMELFWKDNNGLPEEEIQRLWAARRNEYTTVLGGPEAISHTKSDTAINRRSPYGSFHETTPPATRVVPERVPLQRNEQSVGSAQPQLMTKKRSSASHHGPSPFIRCGTPVPPLALDTWQCDTNEPFSAYAVAASSPPSCKIRRTSHGRLPVQISERQSEATIYEPAEFIKQSQMSSSNLSQIQSRPDANRHRPTLSPSTLSSSPLSHSPAASQSDAATYLTTPTSIGMSRDSSLAGSFCGGFGMMQVNSQASEAPSNPDPHTEDLGPTFSGSCFAANTRAAEEPLLDFALSGIQTDGKLGDSFPPPTFDSLTVEVPRLPSDRNDMSMNRSSYSDSDSSTRSRVSRRSQEQVALSARPIAPKEEVAESMSRQSSTSSSASALDMSRERSADGTKVKISKTQYVRPTHEKIKCPRCNEKPDGYRGSHELARHTNRAHEPTRIAWRCVDPTPDKQFLSGCKACTAKKEYGAYYNAAAHLRRCHFHAKEKGFKNKGKMHPGRGSRGGGDDPPMDVLKNYMEQFEIVAPENVAPLGDDEDDDDLLADQTNEANRINYDYQQSGTGLEQNAVPFFPENNPRDDASSTYNQKSAEHEYSTNPMRPGFSSTSQFAKINSFEVEELHPASLTYPSATAAFDPRNSAYLPFPPVNNSLAMGTFEYNEPLTSSMPHPLDSLDAFESTLFDT